MNNVQWVLAISLTVGLIGHFVIYRLCLVIAKSSKTKLDETAVKYAFRPAMWTLIAVIDRLIILTIGEPDEFALERHILSLCLIVFISWLAVKATSIFEVYITRQFDVAKSDNLKARKIHTQFRVIKRIAIVVVITLATGTMLMTFDKVRQLGTTILASAGIIGIVVGIAAQKTIETFIAGLQIAFTQPIRIDDVVIVENEWGRIEEITLSYVVVKIWDQRRLIVPITYFIQKPFQNWTRTTSEILGTVFIYTDHTVPIDAVRKKLQELLNDSPLWDKRVCVLQVTNTTEKTIELRALMSAPDASKAWDLRCQIREKLVEFIQSNYPETLPKLRASLEKLPEN